MNLEDYGLEILLSTLGIPDFYRSFIKGQSEKLEMIASYLTGGLENKTSLDPLSPKVHLVIEEIEKDLYESIPPQIPYITKWFWPEWKEYAVCFSHDVDKISESKSHIWKIRKRFSRFDVLKALLGISNPYNNLKDYLKIEKRYGVRSSYYFLVNQYDFNKIINDIQLLQKNKMDIGLHGGFGTHNDYEKIYNEKIELEKVLNQRIVGTRQHFIRIEIPDSWYIHNKAGFLYDTTLGFRDKIGFRLGFAFPFFTPNANLEMAELVEIPLLIMDAAVWTWLKHTEQSALQSIIHFRDIIWQFHGLLTILWHQCVLKMRGGRIYKEVLKNLVTNSGYIATGAEIAEWWRARKDFQINVTCKVNEISVQLYNPRKINNLGLLIRTKNKVEVTSLSSNLILVENSGSIIKILFLNGSSGKIELKNV